MKSKKFQKKLGLNKTTVAHLNHGAMKGVHGGARTFVLACLSGDPAGSCGDTCYTCDCPTATCNCTDTCHTCGATCVSQCLCTLTDPYC
jgi:hypothetical protein